MPQCVTTKCIARQQDDINCEDNRADANAMAADQDEHFLDGQRFLFRAVNLGMEIERISQWISRKLISVRYHSASPYRIYQS